MIQIRANGVGQHRVAALDRYNTAEDLFWAYCYILVGKQAVSLTLTVLLAFSVNQQQSKGEYENVLRNPTFMRSGDKAITTCRIYLELRIAF